MAFLSRASTFSLLALASVIFASSAAHAQPGDPGSAGSEGSETRDLRVAVVVVTALGVAPDEAQAMGARLGEAVGQTLQVEIVPDDALRAELDEPALQTCVANPGCVQRASEILGASEILFLAIVRIGERVQMNITWADGSSGVTDSRDPVRIEQTDLEQPDRERAIFAQAASRLVPDARRRPDAPDPLAPVVKPVVEPAVTRTESPISKPGPRRFTPGVWITGGVAVTALAGGATFGFLAQRTDRALARDGCDEMECGDREARVDRLEFRSAVADTLFVTAAVAGAAAAFLYWRSGGDPEKPGPPSVSVGATPNGAQVILSGSF